MARGTDTDFATTLGMLHTAVTNTGNELRQALSTSVDKLEASGQASQQETTRTVVDELGRMRTNLREARDRLSAGGDMLNTEVRQAVTELRTEMRDVRAALETITPPSPYTSTEAHLSSYEPTANSTPNSGTFLSPGAAPQPAPVTAAPEHDDPSAQPFGVQIPAQRDGEDSDQPPGVAGLPVDLIQQAVREVLSEELAPLFALLAELKEGQNDSAAAVQDDVRTHLREVVGELREELHAARLETAAGLEQLRPHSDDEPAAVSEEHSELLKQAARVSSVDLLCHRDVWEFITAEAGRHPHFRVPPQVAGEGGERVRAALSGRSLIALLISLHAVGHTARNGDGDQELATTLYERIAASLTGLTPRGEPVTITLDDRSFPSDEAAPSSTTESPSGRNDEDEQPAVGASG
ncbi:hypothetical protein [Streptomyces sp. NPDC060366]|uniref:hypothetical protein n=1 Tax=Streptomyces sp. NPDC060366 TaxID=3347105 RepID=UPI0036691BBD